MSCNPQQSLLLLPALGLTWYGGHKRPPLFDPDPQQQSVHYRKWTKPLSKAVRGQLDTIIRTNNRSSRRCFLLSGPPQVQCCWSRFFKTRRLHTLYFVLFFLDIIVQIEVQLFPLILTVVSKLASQYELCLRLINWVWILISLGEVFVEYTVEPRHHRQIGTLNHFIPFVKGLFAALLSMIKKLSCLKI